MLERLVDAFVSGFVFPGILWNQLFIGIGLAIVFGTVWFAPYWTPILKKPWAWAVLAGSAIVTWIAVAFIQGSFTYWTNSWFINQFGQETFQSQILLMAIPSILYTGLVQEGSKLVPVVIWWWKFSRNIDPKLGLAIGVVAGLGFGIFEAVWLHNKTFMAGWTWEAVQSGGLLALAPFWERFFAVGLHVAMSGLAGYGLAKGWGWQFYLLASFLHALTNYSAILLISKVMTGIQVEIYLAVMTTIVTGVVLWLRWKKLDISSIA